MPAQSTVRIFIIGTDDADIAALESTLTLAPHMAVTRMIAPVDLSEISEPDVVVCRPEVRALVTFAVPEAPITFPEFEEVV